MKQFTDEDRDFLTHCWGKAVERMAGHTDESALSLHVANLAERNAYLEEAHASLLADCKCALAALSQIATYPADIHVAHHVLEHAINTLQEHANADTN